MFEIVYWTIHKGFTLLDLGESRNVSNAEGLLRHLGRKHPEWTHGTYAIKGKIGSFVKRNGMVWRKRKGSGTVDHAFRDDKDELARRAMKIQIKGEGY